MRKLNATFIELVISPQIQGGSLILALLGAVAEVPQHRDNSGIRSRARMSIALQSDAGHAEEMNLPHLQSDGVSVSSAQTHTNTHVSAAMTKHPTGQQQLVQA